VEDFLISALDDVHIITLFYPFLNRFALLHWGLPMGFYAPEKIVGKAVASLLPGGLLVSFHQTPGERDVMLSLLKSAGTAVEKTIPLQSRLVHYWRETTDRWAIVARKPETPV
jgi:hypothetical protein